MNKIDLISYLHHTVVGQSKINILLSESAEDCVWRLLGEQPLGRMLEETAGDNYELVIKLYLKDYLHMVYKPATNQEEEFQVRKIMIE